MNEIKPKTLRAIAKAGLFAVVGVALPVSAADVNSYSYPDGIVFTGGGPGAGQFVADKVIVTRATQFAQFGRAGYVEALQLPRYAGAGGAVTDGQDGGGTLKVVRSHEDKRYERLVDRLGRE